MTKKKKPRKSKANQAGDDNAVVGKAVPAGAGQSQTDDCDTAECVEIDDVNPAGEAHGSRLQTLFAVAEAYGQRSFENYARIRSLAETLRDELCTWLSEDPDCVFLVPPEGRFSARNYQSAAFSVAGTGYLPLKPISFGLAVRVSSDKDFMRLKITCRKEGGIMFVRVENGSETDVPQPITDGSLTPLCEAIYAHLTDFFQDRINDYDNGRYGVQEIGFDIQRMSS